MATAKNNGNGHGKTIRRTGSGEASDAQSEARSDERSDAKRAPNGKDTKATLKTVEAPDDAAGGEAREPVEERAASDKAPEKKKLEKKSSSKKPTKVKLEFESTLTRDEAAAYFEAIARGLRKGSIHFHRKDESVLLSPTEHVGIEVRASRKGGREKLGFEFAWRTDRESHLEIVAGAAGERSSS